MFSPGPTASTGVVVLTNSKPCLCEKGLNCLHLGVQRILSFENNSFTDLIYTFITISHCVLSNLVH